MRWCKAVRATEPEVPQHIQGRRHPKTGMHVNRRRRQRLVWCGRGRVANPQRTCPELRQPERVTFRLLTFLNRLEGSFVRRVAAHVIRARCPGVNQRGHHCPVQLRRRRSHVDGLKVVLIDSAAHLPLQCLSAAPKPLEFLTVVRARANLPIAFLMKGVHHTRAQPTLPMQGPPPNLAIFRPMSARQDFETPPR